MKKKTTNQEQPKKLAVGLSGLLADTYVLYNATQACHWNVEGPQFHSLHGMFEDQYRELAEAVDTIAERIRVLGFYAPATLPKLTKLSRIQQPGDLRGASDMLEHLIGAHEQVVHRAVEVRGDAEHVLDEATADLLVERLRRHEKTLWMLRSQAGRDSSQLSAVEEIARAS